MDLTIVPEPEPNWRSLYESMKKERDDWRKQALRESERHTETKIIFARYQFYYPENHK